MAAAPNTQHSAPATRSDASLLTFLRNNSGTSQNAKPAATAASPMPRSTPNAASISGTLSTVA